MNLGHRRERRSSSWRFRYLVGIAALVLVDTASGETWRGLTVATEHRCSAYDRKRDYPYPQSVEREIVRRLGAIYGPYTGTCFDSTRKTDIEHIVATSEAHDIGAREGFRSGGRERHRPARALQRQPERQDHVHGGTRHGIEHVHRSHPAYRFMRDGDGVVCE